MKCSTMELVERLGYYMLEGNTYAECAEEFRLKQAFVKRLINDNLGIVNPKLLRMIRNKPYMVFQRVIYRECSLKEARKVFQVSQKDFDEFLIGIYKKDFKKYIIMKTKIYNVQV